MRSEWEPADHLLARLYYTVFRCLTEQQTWAWKSEDGSPLGAVSILSVLQGSNLLTLAWLLEWRPQPRALAYAVALLPLVSNSYLLLWRGRSALILKRASLYDHLSGPWGTALTIAYGMGSFVLLAWAGGYSLPM